MIAPRLLNRRTRDALGALDPAADEPPTPRDQLDALAAALVAGHGHPVDDRVATTDQEWLGDGPGNGGREHRPVRSGGPPRRPAVIVGLVVVATVLVVGGITLNRRDRITVAPSAPVGAAERQAVAVVAPLAAGRSVRCGWATVSSDLFAAPGGADRGESESAIALRDFLGTKPSAGAAPVGDGGWVLMAEQPGRLVFGQRSGAVGFSSVVFLDKTDGRWSGSYDRGCGVAPVVPAPGEHAAAVDSATLHGSELVLSWTNGSCDPRTRTPSDLLVRTETRLTATGLHVLIVTRPNPRQPTGACGGVGIDSTANVTLTAPLGSSPVRDDSSVPSRVLSIER